MLEYDSNKRGDQQAFKLIHELMRKYVVQVFSVDTYESFSYEITKNTTLKEFKDKLSVNTNINPKHQYLILPNGETANEQIGAQIIDSWYMPDSWFEHYNPIVINVFDYSKNLDYFEFYKSLTLPQMVEKMLLFPGRTMEYDEIKLTWRHSVWVARQSVRKYQLLQSALKSCLLSCINVFNHLQEKHHQLCTSLNALFASVQVLKNFIRFSSDQSKQLISINSDINKSSEKPDDQTAIKQNVDLCLKIVTILKSIYKFRRDKVRPLFEKTQTIVPRFEKNNFMFENLLKSPEVDASLMRKYHDVLAAYDSLRKKKKEERNKQTPNSHMVSLLCDCFQQVETLMKEMFQILKIFLSFIKEIDQICRTNEEFQKLIENWQKTTTELHTESWSHLTKCFAPTKTQTPTAIHSKLMALSISNHNQTNQTNISQHLNQIDSLLVELEQSQSLWNNEKIEFSHLELYNLLF